MKCAICKEVINTCPEDDKIVTLLVHGKKKPVCYTCACKIRGV